MTYELPVVAIRMVHERPWTSKEPLDSKEKVVEYLKKEMYDFDREEVIVINMDNKLKPISLNVASIGTTNASLVSSREIFKSAILSNATSIIMVHNHLSGDVTPSIDDVNITKKIKEAGNIMDIKLLDHIIIGETNHYSFFENGQI